MTVEIRELGSGEGACPGWGGLGFISGPALSVFQMDQGDASFQIFSRVSIFHGLNKFFGLFQIAVR